MTLLVVGSAYMLAAITMQLNMEIRSEDGSIRRKVDGVEGSTAQLLFQLSPAPSALLAVCALELRRLNSHPSGASFVEYVTGHLLCHGICRTKVFTTPDETSGKELNPRVLKITYTQSRSHTF